MYLVNLTYKVAIEEILLNLEEHNKFLEKNYKAGNFILSGRKNPRVGGMIFTQVKDLNKLKEIFTEDPFYYKGLSNYEFIDVIPTMACKELSHLVEKI